jgi:hypothetical protein
MENNADEENVVVRNGTASSLTAAQTVTASMAALARTVEQTEAQLRTQVRAATKFPQTFFYILWLHGDFKFYFKGSSDFSKYF